jgi:endoglucanase
VYLDAGNSAWVPVDVMAARLGAAGIALADGFALNVSNFNATGAELGYGNALSSRVGGRHFVIDTSRNGAGPASTWCNPDGRALGERPA